MSKTFTYKEYTGSIGCNVDDEVLFGKIEFINDLVTYEAATMPELKAAFEESVDDYLETCKLVAKEPDKRMSGTLNVRIGSDLHKQVAKAALENNVSINDLIKASIDEKVNAKDSNYHIHFHPTVTNDMNISFSRNIEVPDWESKESSKFDIAQTHLKLVN